MKISAKLIVTLLLCAWAMGIGLRFFYAWSVGGYVYTPNTFDAFFDWAGLAALGFSVAMFNWRDFLLERLC